VCSAPRGCDGSSVLTRIFVEDGGLMAPGGGEDEPGRDFFVGGPSTSRGDVAEDDCRARLGMWTPSNERETDLRRVS